MRQIKTADFVDVVLFADDIELGVDSIQQSGHRHWTDEATDGGESHNITEHYCNAVEHLTARINRQTFMASRINFYSYIAISLIRISDIANSN